MTGILRRSFLATLFIWIALTVLFFLRSGSAPVELTTAHTSSLPLYGFLHDFEAAMPIYVDEIAIVLLSLISGLIITRIMVRNLILQERSYISAVAFVTVAYGTCVGGYSLTAALLSFLLLCASDLLISSFRRELVLGSVFNASLMVGICILVDAHVLIYIPILASAMIIFRKNWRGWLVSLTGLILPFAICSYVYWGVGESIAYVGEAMRNGIVESFTEGAFPARLRDPSLLFFWGITALAVIISVIGFLRGAGFLRTRPYKTYLYFMWILLFSSLLFVIPGRSVIDFALLAIPVSVIITAYLSRSHTRMASITYFVLLLGVIVYNLLPVILSR